MLILSIKWSTPVYITPDLLQHLEDLIESKIVTPIKTFAQYVDSGTSFTENAAHYQIIEKHYGSDIAKTMTTIQALESFSDIAGLRAKITKVLEASMDCKLVPSFGKTVYLFDGQKSKILHEYHDFSLADYQQKNPGGIYISRLDNIWFVESPDKNFGQSIKPKFLRFA